VKVPTLGSTSQGSIAQKFAGGDNKVCLNDNNLINSDKESTPARATIQPSASNFQAWRSTYISLPENDMRCGAQRQFPSLPNESKSPLGFSHIPGQD
jgi:hypothetical protein